MGKTKLVKYLVVSYDSDEQQWFYDLILAKDSEDAGEYICSLRPYVIAADATRPKDFDFAVGYARRTDDVLSECDNCSEVSPQSELKPIKDYSLRVEAGEETPSGECPHCGALCHLKSWQQPGRAKQSTRRIKWRQR